jgi:hypothetical protein
MVAVGGHLVVPEDEYDCKFGRLGWGGRALRDTPRFALRPAFVPVLPLTTAVATEVATHALSGEPVLAVVIGAAVGVVVGLGVVAALAATIWGRRQHWRVVIGTLEDKSRDHTFISLKSREWHTIINLRCTVTDPYGVARTSRVPNHTKDLPVILSPGERITLCYPSGFNAPWPNPGIYRVAWEADVEGRRRPVVVRRKRWHVGPPLAVRGTARWSRRRGASYSRPNSTDNFVRVAVTR